MITVGNSRGKDMKAIFEAMNPSIKLFSALLLGMAAIIWPGPIMGITAVVLLLSLAASMGMGYVLTKVVLGFGVPLTIMLLIIQGCYSHANVTILLDLGFIKLGLEGTIYAIKTVMTLLTFLEGLYLVEKTTSIGELVTDLEERGLSPHAGYLVLASLNIVPQMRRKLITIQEAQACRGLQINGGLIARLKATIPLLGPVVISSLADAEQRSMALEIRGFGLNGSSHSSYVVVHHASHDQAVLSVSCFAVVASSIARLTSYLL